MYKKLLLASAFVASAVAGQAAEYFIVKDGKVAEGVELLKSGNPNLIIEEGVEAPGGEGEYLHYSVPDTVTAKLYAGRFFYIANGIDINQAWMCDITYYFPEGSESDGTNLKRESMRLDFLCDTITVEGDTFKYDYNQASRRIAHLGYDVYLRNFYEYDEETEALAYKGQGLGKDVTVSRYMYTRPSFKAVGGESNIIKTVSLACAPEAPSTPIAINYYIKEIRVYSEGVKPFYNEPFHSAQDMAYISGAGSNMTIFNVTENADGSGAVAVFNEKVKGYSYDELFGCTYLCATTDKVPAGKKSFPIGSFATNCIRLWQSDGYACKDGLFYDTEVGIMMNVAPVTKRAENPYMIRIPFTGAAEAGEKINVKLLFGHNGGADCAAYSDYDKASEALPFAYRFEKGDLDGYSASTPVADFASIDSVPVNIIAVDEDIVVPEGDYNILTLFIRPMSAIEYVVGDLQVRGSKTVTVKDWAEDEAGRVKMPFTFQEVSDGVNEVIAENTLSIYPNPTEDVFTVAGDVEKVEVISLTGAVLKTVNTNIVDIKTLPAGVYVVKAYTEAGIKTANVIKK